jgi:hypothetical protein
MTQKFITAPVALAAFLMGSTALYAQTAVETRSVSASVSGALQGDTGFLTGGQVLVNGVGQGSVTLARNNSMITSTAGATATIGDSTNFTNVPVTSSEMITTFDFNRDVDTAAALVGIGTVVAQGESLGGVAVVGNATSNASRGGTTAEGGVGNSTAPTIASGSLVGNFSTANTMQLVGTGSLFAGSQALNLGERNLGATIGKTGSVSADAAQEGGSGISFSGLTFAQPTNNGSPAYANNGTAFIDANGDPIVQGSSESLPDALLDRGVRVAGIDSFAPSNIGGSGAGFWMSPTLNNGNTIALNVANAGNGSVSVTASTGGFFGQGTTWQANAAPTFSNVGFFSAPTTPTTTPAP